MIDRILAKLRLKGFERDFRAGYKKSIHEARNLCRKYGLDEPAWLKDLSPSRGRGRHANIEDQAEDLDAWRIKLAAIKTCQYAKRSNPNLDVLAEAQRLIKKAIGKEYSLETLAEAKKNAPNEARPRMIDFQFFQEELGIIEKDGEIIDLSDWTPPRGRPRKIKK